MGKESFRISRALGRKLFWLCAQNGGESWIRSKISLQIGNNVIAVWQIAGNVGEKEHPRHGPRRENVAEVFDADAGWMQLASHAVISQQIALAVVRRLHAASGDEDEDLVVPAGG